jgi:signal transduction histidine kinase/CheY-like chemotaxis protein
MMENQTPAQALNFDSQVAIEKLQQMHQYSKSSTIATVLAPLLCIPLYLESTDVVLFKAWFVTMTLAVIARIFLIRSIQLDKSSPHDQLKLGLAIGIVTFSWGIGWFFFVQPSDMVSYLIYQIISLTVLFVGMVGYCIDWKTFSSFVIPLKIPELIFISLNFHEIVWPIALGSMVAFFLALKMAFLFSNSWEKSFSLRIKNDALFNQLVEEKNASMAANIAKSEFISTASHDLRQPMQSINIFIDMIDAHELRDDHNSIFSRIRKSVSVLNRMFNTLLDVSKLDSNFSVNERNFHLMDIIHALEDNFSGMCQEKNITLSFQGGDFRVNGDRNLTEQILRNLLSNAIQYTDEGMVTVTFSDLQTGLLSFTVEDSGCGIPAEDLPLIFKEFYRSDHSRSHYDGLGLGLSIVNRIVKKIQGECIVESEVGKGSVFTIHTHFTIAPKLKTIQAKGVDANAESDAALQENTRLSSAHNAVHLGIIENDPSLLNAYQQYFTQAGYKVHIIPHDEHAFEGYLEFMPKLDFILSDYRLEGHDGIYFIQKLREEFNHDIPACIVTADTSPQHLELFSQHHIEVMYKPIDIKSVEAFISERTR